MKTQTFVLVSTIIFGLVAIMHLVRAVQGWTVQLGPYAIPAAVSWIGLLIGGALCLWGFACLRR
ncbi:hypothetical protein [Dokdonella soli]|uniref:DUF3955 domain-containing protein n=1 Tax=Dokdonella soli TaxID=529810 RepID=A0ABN1IVG7_9GAMM